MSVKREIRLSTPSDRDAILDFIERSGFNPRDAVTWDGLKMSAMTAWEGRELIGAIPFEARHLQIAPGRTIQTIHETVVAIDPAHRAGGLGSKMQSVLFQQRPSNAELITVFREDSSSPAYRWYLKNGFHPVVNIESWFCDHPTVDPLPARLWNALDPAAPWPGVELPAGRVRRDLKPWLAVHPYRNRYAFHIAGDSAGSVALLGVGTMHSQTERVDVLDWIAPNEPAAENLLRSVAAIAARKNWHPIRVPLAAGDPLTVLLSKLGYQSRWSFDMLARPLSPAVDLTGIDFTQWRYAGIDYI